MCQLFLSPIVCKIIQVHFCPQKWSFSPWLTVSFDKCLWNINMLSSIKYETSTLAHSFLFVSKQMKRKGNLIVIYLSTIIEKTIHNANGTREWHDAEIKKQQQKQQITKLTLGQPKIRF